eukprot:2954649-Pleurochrysis_carterae.AAC.1
MRSEHSALPARGGAHTQSAGGAARKSGPRERECKLRRDTVGGERKGIEICRLTEGRGKALSDIDG